MSVHSFTLVPAAYLFLLREREGRTETLLQLRRNTGYMDGYWACGVAGHVEAGESVLATAIREAREEVGLEISEADLTPLTTVHRSNAPGGPALEQRVDFFFTTRTWHGTPAVQEAEKNAGLAWFSLTDLPELVPPHERLVLTHLARIFDAEASVPPILTFGFHGETIEQYKVAREH